MDNSSPCILEVAKELGYKNIHVSYSKRLRKSWKLKSYFTGKKELTLPATLSPAPFDVKEALLHWSNLKRPHFRKNRQSYYKYKRELENKVWSYLKDCNGVNHIRGISLNKLQNLKTKGRKYNLKEIFDYLNLLYFNNELKSFVRWGQKGTKTSYQTWYQLNESEKVSMITIASLYNHPDIPEYAIKSVMFHEMLHIAVPPYIKNSRRVVHGREFNEAQKRNPDLLIWQKWEKEGLQKILRSRNF